ncbi:MAG: peptidoglycan DD-metalloendopeptidase family protein [Candidatus Pacebacteria bacterium]|nr:peptidoglycan DD-metalloendopeptidase family protein [Candidatus Paceibacterota bacterium]
MPQNAKAGFLGDLLSGEVFAKNGSETISNSQNMTILEANVSSLSSNNKESLDEGAPVNISGDALSVSAGPSIVSGDTEDPDASYEEISIYVVRSGDTVQTIAKLFKVSPNTILWTNDLKKGEKLTVGDTLIILPVDGVKHTVKKGDTIKNIAKLYDVSVGDIYSFNDLDEKSVLKIGDEIIIPGAELKEPEKKTVVSKKKTSVVNVNVKTGGSFPNNYYSADNSNSTGGFVKPIPCRLTQGKHDRYAVDMSCGKSGTPIVASASGKVIFAKYGWNGAFGNLVIISHPNGTQTFYAHQSKIAVSVGDQVKQGEIIGYVGNTGRSTGPHLHFEVRGAKNPGFDNSWAD